MVLKVVRIFQNPKSHISLVTGIPMDSGIIYFQNEIYSWNSTWINWPVVIFISSII